MTGDARPGLPQRREPDLGDLAVFTVDSAGLVTSWPQSMARLCGKPADVVVGHDVRDVLLTGPGQRELTDHALAEVAAGRVWSGTMAGGRLSDGRFTVRWEPHFSAGTRGAPAHAGDSRDGRAGTLNGQGGAVVLLRRAWPQPPPSWLAAAAAVGVGGTLDLGRTAREITEVAVPAFADGAVVYIAEHLLTADEAAAMRAGQGMAARRLAGRLADGTPSDAESLLPAGEVIIFEPGSPG